MKKPTQAEVTAAFKFIADNPEMFRWQPVCCSAIEYREGQRPRLTGPRKYEVCTLNEEGDIDQRVGPFNSFEEAQTEADRRNAQGMWRELEAQ